jgi:hypothetical protein
MPSANQLLCDGKAGAGCRRGQGSPPDNIDYHHSQRPVPQGRIIGHVIGRVAEEPEKRAVYGCGFPIDGSRDTEINNPDDVKDVKKKGGAHAEIVGHQVADTALVKRLSDHAEPDKIDDQKYDHTDQPDHQQFGQGFTFSHRLNLPLFKIVMLFHTCEPQVWS